VIIGIGIATLIATNGNTLINVSNVDGVKVSGVLLQAGPVNSPTLLTWGSKGYAGTASNPGSISDVYARVGGTNGSGSNMVTTMVQVNSGNVIIDNVWLWRADHDVKGPVKNKRNPV